MGQGIGFVFLAEGEKVPQRIGKGVCPVSGNGSILRAMGSLQHDFSVCPETSHCFAFFAISWRSLRETNHIPN